VEDETMTLKLLHQRFPLTYERPLLVTEITHMTSGICIGAYDIHGGRMVRPLPVTRGCRQLSQSRTATNWMAA